MLKFFHAQSETITGAAIIIAGATLLNKIVGVGRDRAITHIFGGGPVVDVYFAAFKIPDLIYGLLVVGALSAGFIPVFTKIFKNNGKDQGWLLANNVLNILSATLIFLSVLGILFSSKISPLIAPGFDAGRRDLLTSFMRVIFLSPALLGVSMIFGGILQSLRLFVLYSIAPIFYNLGIIFGALFLVPILGPIGLADGVILGAFLHLLIQFIGALKAGYHWQWTFNLKDKETKLIGRLMIPRTLGLAVNNLNIVITTILASLLPVGSVAALNLADNLQWVPISIIGISLALAAFPVLSSAAADNNKEEFRKALSSTIRQILFLIIPLSLVFLLLRAQIVRVVYGSEAFDWNSTIQTADALAFFSLGLCAQALIPLLARGFYALSDTKTPFVIAVISGLLNIIFSILLMRPLGVAGLALAVSISAFINMILLFVSLRKITGNLDDGKILYSLYKISIAGLFMALLMQGLKYPLAKIFNQDYFWGIFGQGAVAGLSGLFLYGFICYILKLPEFMRFKNSWQGRWLKIRNLPAEGSAETKE